MRIVLITLAASLGLLFGWGAFALGALSFDGVVLASEDVVGGAGFCAVLAAVTAAVAFETE